MDMQKQLALKKVQAWFNNASDWQKDLFCTLWDQSATSNHYPFHWYTTLLKKLENPHHQYC